MKLKIDEPCPADWNQMKIGLHARFCDSCDKNVYDFTDKSRAEIIAYLLSNPNERTCGRLRPDQFDFKHEDVPVLVKILEEQKNPNRFLIFALVCLSLSACAQENGNNGIQPTLGEIAPLPDTTYITPPEINELKIGKIAVQPEPDTSNVVIETGEIVLQGDICIAQPPVKGNIEIPQPPEPPSEPKVHQFAERMPEYPGGLQAMMNYINDYFEQKNIKQEGNIYVRFVVNEDGSLSHLEFLRIDTGLANLGLKSEVENLISSMPKWIPGEIDGKQVKVYMTIPIRFSR